MAKTGQESNMQHYILSVSREVETQAGNSKKRLISTRTPIGAYAVGF